jgi:hypothetical protein
VISENGCLLPRFCQNPKSCATPCLSRTSSTLINNLDQYPERLHITMSTTGIGVDLMILRLNPTPVTAVDWPTGPGPSQFVCGTIPYSNAPCFNASATGYFNSNIASTQPPTFTSCCNGPIINITQPVTNTSDPSFGATCLAYCEVDYWRVIDFWGDYYGCLNNVSNVVVEGIVTCGWLNTDAHDQCEISLSIVESISVFPSEYGSPATTRNLSTVGSTTFSSCPPKSTSASVTGTSSISSASAVSTSSISSPSPTAKSAANVHPCVPENPTCRNDFMIWRS